MRYLLASILGATAGLSFQLQLPLIVVFPTLIMMFLLTFRVNRRGWILLWNLYALLQFVLGLRWLDIVGFDIVLVVSIFCLTSFLAATIITSFVIDQTQRILWFVLSLTLCENIRDSFPFGGFGWLQYGMILVDTPLFVLHRVLPQLLVTLLVLAVSAFIALVLLNKISRPRLVGISLSLTAIIALSYINFIQLDSTRTFNVIAVQGGVERYGLGVLGNRTEVLQNHIAVTEANITSVNMADVLLWPENSLDIDPSIEPRAAELIEAIDTVVVPPILLGSVLSPTSTTRSNTTIELNEGVREIYTKQRLVPVGEFLPFRDFASRLTDRVDLLPYDFISGTTPGIWKRGNLQLSIGICFEVADTSIIHQGIENSDAVVIQTNNATYQFSNQSEQQLLYAKIRSIETGRPLISISTSGVSALISEGGILKSIEKGQTGVISFDIGNYSGKTITTLLSPMAGWIVFALWLAMFIYILREKSR
jgi:apolipoprotein N-acyltransferase